MVVVSCDMGDFKEERLLAKEAVPFGNGESVVNRSVLELGVSLLTN